MALSRRNLRTIVVDDVRYCWQAKVDPGQYVSITVQGGLRTGQVLQLIAGFEFDGVDLPLPRRVRRLIVNGLKAGWTPNEAGPTMLFRNFRPRD